MKDDSKNRVYALYFPVGCRNKSHIWRQRRPEYLSRITMNTTRALSLSFPPPFCLSPFLRG